jgi:hypothetical protein
METASGERAVGQYRVHGVLIIAGSVLALGGMAVHPSGAGKVMDMVRDLAANGSFNAYVHGFLIAVYLVLTLGFFGFTRWLGGDRIAAQAGLVAYAASAVAATAAAMSAGFVNRTLAFAYLEAKPEQVDSVVAAFRVSGAFNYAWGRMWMIAMSAAILLWSIELVRRTGSERLVGWFGVALGAVSIAGFVLGLIPLTVVALIGIIAAQTVWSIGVGVLMVRSR